MVRSRHVPTDAGGDARAPDGRERHRGDRAADARSPHASGAGYAYDRSYDRSNGAPMLMVGAEHRVSRGLKLVTENYAFSGGGIASGGIRWIRDRLAVDFAIVAPSDGDTLIAFPLVNVVWTFGRPR